MLTTKWIQFQDQEATWWDDSAVTHMIELTTERVQTADFILEVGAWCILVSFGTVQDVGNQTGELMGYVYIEMERNIKASSFFILAQPCIQICEFP